MGLIVLPVRLRSWAAFLKAELPGLASGLNLIQLISAQAHRPDPELEQAIKKCLTSQRRCRTPAASLLLSYTAGAVRRQLPSGTPFRYFPQVAQT